MRLLQDQITRLKEAAKCLQLIDIKLEILQSTETPLIPKQKEIVRKQITETADQYSKMIDEIIADHQKEPEVIMCHREDMVTIAEGFKYPDFHLHEGI